jgi:NAD-dependent deacetylase
VSSIPDASALLRSAKRVVVFTGAGVSAESGIPTYRSGDTAFWSVEKFERYANPRGYRAHLPDSYEWYRQRAIAVAAAHPNPAHQAIVTLASRVPYVTVVTQNVDGLHIRAGSQDVIELHGHLRSARCDSCRVEIGWSTAPQEPHCLACNGMLRPNVVMFEEMLSETDLERARELAEECDVLISAGTSNLVWPAKELPMIAHASGAAVIIVNPDLSEQPWGHRIVQLEGLAGEILPDIVGAP